VGGAPKPKKRKRKRTWGDDINFSAEVRGVSSAKRKREIELARIQKEEKGEKGEKERN